MKNEVLLQCSGIHKSFGPTKALANVSLEIRRGEIHGLIGENGSGKSTLTSIFAGVQKADSGTMTVRGEPYHPNTVLDGQKQKIGMLVQEMGTMESLTVAENVFAGNFAKFMRFGITNDKAMNAEAQRILNDIHATEIIPQMPTIIYNFEDRKIIEIARVMAFEPDILIVDETTTALAQKGRKIIYDIMKKMQQENKAVIFISHDLDELVEICNVVTILRDGHIIDTLKEGQITVSAMRRLMVGREMTDHYFRADYDGTYDSTVVLRAEHITSEDGRIRNLNLELHKGEILGIGGLANSGMHELGQMMFGIARTLTGQVVHLESGRTIHSPVDSVKQKMGYVSKNRDLESLVLTGSIKDNIAIASLDALSKKVFISSGREKALAEKQITALRIKCVNEKQPCVQLSGGNKQKVALGKWLANDSDIFIIDCPTRGIDIGVKAAVYEMLYALKKAGKSILMVSEELVELIGMSDRMLIMKDGAITAEFTRSETLKDSDLIEYMI